MKSRLSGGGDFDLLLETRLLYGVIHVWCLKYSLELYEKLKIIFVYTKDRGGLKNNFLIDVSYKQFLCCEFTLWSSIIISLISIEINYLGHVFKIFFSWSLMTIRGIFCMFSKHAGDFFGIFKRFWKTIYFVMTVLDKYIEIAGY